MLSSQWKWNTRPSSTRVGRSNHWAMGDSHEDQEFASRDYVGLFKKSKQHTDLLASRKHLKKVFCTLWSQPAIQVW